MNPLLPNLEFLDLTSNRIINIEGISQCYRLKELYLGYNFLSDEQLEILKNFKDLTVLDISHNHLKDENVTKITESFDKLRILINNSNDFSCIIFEKNSLSLEEIYLDDNKLQKLEFKKPKVAINTLHIKNNNLNDISGLSNLESLKVLAFDNNKLKKIDDLSLLKNLTRVTGSNNNMEKVAFDTRNEIEYIDFAKNELTNIDFLSQCLNINMAYLAGNKILSMSNDESYYMNLVSLDLS